MARKHNPADDPADETVASNSETPQGENSNGADSTFQMQDGRWSRFESNVLTLHFDTAEDGDFKVPPEQLKDEKGKYRFSRAVIVPSLPSVVRRDANGAKVFELDKSAMTDKETVLAAIGDLIDQLDAYDKATSYASPDGSKILPRKYRVCEQQDGTPLSVPLYVAVTVWNELKLSLQKRMYKEARSQAEETMMSELGKTAPAGKPKRTRAVADATPVDATTAFDEIS